jgi:hypothetical protein
MRVDPLAGKVHALVGLGLVTTSQKAGLSRHGAYSSIASSTLQKGTTYTQFRVFPPEKLIHPASTL